MIVAEISKTLAEELKGTTFDSVQYFNPIEFESGRFFISLVEAQYLKLNQVVSWFNYEPKIEELDSINSEV